MAESKAGSFSAYMEYAQRSSPEGSVRSTTGPASLLSLLNHMPPDGTAMDQLAERCGMSAPAFRNALKKLSDSAFVEISGPPLSEVVRLTEKGRDAATLL
jgi:DNA-binding MarR family transcriptional regulator